MVMNGVHAKLFPSVADDIEANRPYFRDAGFSLSGWVWMRTVPNGHPSDMEVFTVEFCSAAGKWEAKHGQSYDNSIFWVSPGFADPVSAYVYAEAAQWGQ